MTEHERGQPPAERGAQEPTPTSQAAATDEMTDEQLDQVAGGKIIIDVEKVERA
jgi:hypothetical protein